MTDKTQPDSGRATGGIVEMLHARIAELEARVQELGAMARENRSRRIVELEAQLAAVGAGGAQALSAAPVVDIATAGEMQAFEAWYKQDCVIEGAAAKMAAKAAWEARATLAASPPAEQQARWVERWHGSGGKEFWEGWSILNAANREMIAHLGPDVDPGVVRGIVTAHNDALCGERAGTGGRWCPACAGATPSAEQQATKETSGGFYVWRDISTAPKDGSRFVAIGYNYGLYSEGRHICVAQWFRGCWMEASDWNETSELKYLTHWMPLPSPPDDVAAPAEQQAAPKAAPGEQNTVPAEWLEQAYREGWAACRDAETIGEEAEDWAFGNSAANSRMIDAQQAAPQQEVHERVGVSARNCFLCGHPAEAHPMEPDPRGGMRRGGCPTTPTYLTPQQEAQEPVAFIHWPVSGPPCLVWYSQKALNNAILKTHEDGYKPDVKLYSAPQSAPAPLSEMPYEKRKAIQEGEQISASDAWFKARHEMLDTLDRRNVFRAGFDRGWNAALAAQGGKE